MRNFCHPIFLLVSFIVILDPTIINFWENCPRLQLTIADPLFIKDSKALSNNAVQLTIDKSDNIQSTDIEQILDSKKVDFCIQEKTDTQYKILLCDMDATMIANETLDDLVKLTGVKTNIDETSKLAMEGKIDLRTTLKNRVELLKGCQKWAKVEEVWNRVISLSWN